MFRAICSFTYPTPDGGQGWVRSGEEVPDDAEVLEGREALFARVDIQDLPAKRAVKKAAPKSKK